jgi:hypothetical protein
LDKFIENNFEEKVNTKRKSRTRRSAKSRTSRKERDRNTVNYTEEPLIEDEKKSTEAEVDDRDIYSILPSKPDLKNADGSRANLKLILKARESAIDLWETIYEDEGWKLSKSKNGIDLYKHKRLKASSEVFIKREMIIQAPLEHTIMCMEDCAFQLECNSRLKTLEVVEKIGTHANIIYQQSKSNLLVSSRDFIMVSTRMRLKNNKVLLTNMSIQHEDYPPIKSVVRGRVNAIFVFEQISSKSTHVINILNVDLKGSIPSFASNKMADTQHESFALIRQKIEQYYNTI